MKQFLLSLLVLCSASISAQVNRKICISIDDLPLVKYGVDEEGHEWKITNGILDALVDHSAQGIGFVNAGKLYPNQVLDSSRIAYLEKWLEAGMDLGNHTYAHKNYHRVSFEEYCDDIIKGELVAKELTERHSKKYDFFRHPYLRSGNDSLSTANLTNFLNEKGYRESFVTVDDDDYLFALAYARAYRKNDQQLMTKIGDSYLDYMEAKLKYFEEASLELFDRNVNHTLLIHANFLNAQYLNELLSRYEQMGYSFISQKEAADDPAYATPVTKFGDWGISWIHKWGLSKGMPKSFYEKDPPTPQFIRDLAD